MSKQLKKAVDKAMGIAQDFSMSEYDVLKRRVLDAVQAVFDQETKELQRFHDVHCGLYAFDKGPECVSLEWIRENCFKITTFKGTKK